MLFTVFWRPVGFSTYIFGGGPLFPPNARARVGGNRPEDLDPKTGGDTPGSHNKEPQRGATTRSHNGEPLQAQTDQPDPQFIENKRDEKKKLMKSYD